jgi:hypothetical protein
MSRALFSISLSNNALQVAYDDNSVCTFDPPESIFLFDLENLDIPDDTLVKQSIAHNRQKNVMA